MLNNTSSHCWCSPGAWDDSWLDTCSSSISDLFSTTAKAPENTSRTSSTTQVTLHNRRRQETCPAVRTCTDTLMVNHYHAARSRLPLGALTVIFLWQTGGWPISSPAWEEEVYASVDPAHAVTLCNARRCHTCFLQMVSQWKRLPTSFVAGSVKEETFWKVCGLTHCRYWKALAVITQLILRLKI